MKVDIDQICQELSVASYLNYREYLKDLYLLMKKKNERYSYNQFSEDLKLGFTNVTWLIITSRRRITENTMKKILSALGLHRLESRYFRYMVRYNNAKKIEEKDRFFRLLIETKKLMLASPTSRSQLRYLSNWYHPIIREMCGLADFKSDARWIISKLYVKLLPREVAESLKLLEDLGLIRYSRRRQRHILTEQQIGPDKEIVHVGMEGFHKKILEVASDSITKVPEDLRDFNALSVSLNKSQIHDLKQLIHKFCLDVMKLEEKSSDQDQIYQVNVHTFPFTRE